MVYYTIQHNSEQTIKIQIVDEIQDNKRKKKKKIKINLKKSEERN